jgi:hypothetical protein
MRGELMGRPCLSIATQTRCGASIPINLQKMNPDSGAILWQAQITDSHFTGAADPFVSRVEPLHTTNDVVVGVSATAGGSTEVLYRVSSTGSILWSLPGCAGGKAGSFCPRMFGVDSNGTLLMIPGLTSNFSNNTINAYTLAGGVSSPAWTRSFNLANNANILSMAILGTTAIVAVQREKIGFFNQPIEIHQISTRNGSDQVAPGGGATQYSYPQALDSSGNWLASLSQPQSLGSASGILYGPGPAFTNLSTAVDIVFAGRWSSPGGYSYLGYKTSNGLWYVAGSGNYGVNPVMFELTSVAGVTFGTAGGASLWDTCSDGTAYGYGNCSYYFCGQGWRSSGGVEFSVFKTDEAGNPDWLQAFGSQSHNASAYSLALSDDGYLYAGGAWVTP